MKLTILEVGEVPVPLRPEFGTYPKMFEAMFGEAGAGFDYETIEVSTGTPLPEIDSVEAVLVTGSAAGVYEDHAWIDPLIDFIRVAYERKIPMVGICFGHQIIAEALGGKVRKSQKGWGIGRQVYNVVKHPDFLGSLGPQIAIAASHQDQVVTLPQDAEVFLSSDFAPYAGLIYKNGVTMSVQPHPEFKPEYSKALAHLRRNTVFTDEQVEGVEKSLKQPLDSLDFAKAIMRFLEGVR